MRKSGKARVLWGAVKTARLYVDEGVSMLASISTTRAQDAIISLLSKAVASVSVVVSGEPDGC